MAPLLTQPHKAKDRQKMIEQALKDQAPQSYRELKKAGKLQEFLKDHEEALMESYDQAASELHSRVSGPQGPAKDDYLEAVRQLTMGENQLWEETLANWLEFSDLPESPATTELQTQAT